MDSSTRANAVSGATYERGGDEVADGRNVVEKQRLDFASALGPRRQQMHLQSARKHVTLTCTAVLRKALQSMRPQGSPQLKGPKFL